MIFHEDFIILENPAEFGHMMDSENLQNGLQAQESYFTASPELVVMMLDAVAAITSKTADRQVLKEAAKQIIRFTQADVCRVYEWDLERNQVKVWEEHNKDGAEIPLDWLTPTSLEDQPFRKRVLDELRITQYQLGKPNLPVEFNRFMEQTGIKSLLWVPLVSQMRTIGMIEVIHERKPREFAAEEIAQVQLLAHQAGISLEHAELLRGAEQRAAELEALRQASLSLTASLDLDAVLHSILNSILNLLEDTLDAQVFLYDGEVLSFGAAILADGTASEAWMDTMEDSISYQVARTGEMVVVEDVQELNGGTKSTTDWTIAIVAVPLIIHQKVVGVMNIAYQHLYELSNDDLSVINLLADQAAIAIENARLHDLVSKQAITDDLTKIPNRRAFELRMDQELKRAIRYNRPFTIMMMDLNNFKRINDTYGHPAGDEVLKKTAEILQNNVRDTDFVARFGGDEFILLLPETGFDTAKLISQKLQKKVREVEFQWNEGPVEHVELAIGSAAFPQHGGNPEEIIDIADEALYVEKARMKSNP